MAELGKWYPTVHLRTANDHGSKTLQQKWECPLKEHPESADDWVSDWRDVPEVRVGE